MTLENIMNNSEPLINELAFDFLKYHLYINDSSDDELYDKFEKIYPKLHQFTNQSQTLYKKQKQKQKHKKIKMLHKLWVSFKKQSIEKMLISQKYLLSLRWMNSDFLKAFIEHR